jgi:hypothetical protein
VATELLVLVDLACVVVVAQLAVAGGGVAEQVPDDGEDGPGDGDLGAGLAAAAGDAAVALAQERRGLGCAVGGEGGELQPGNRPASPPAPATARQRTPASYRPAPAEITRPDDDGPARKAQLK